MEGPHREAHEWEEGFWRGGSSGGPGAGASCEPTDRSGMGWRGDLLMLRGWIVSWLPRAS